MSDNRRTGRSTDELDYKRSVYFLEAELNLSRKEHQAALRDLEARCKSISDDRDEWRRFVVHTTALMLCTAVLTFFF